MGELVTHIKGWKQKNGDIHLTGSPIELKEATRDKKPHGIVLILLIKQKQGKRKQTVFYLQKRGANKELYPNRLTVSASGRIRHGESVLEAAKRETQEELGIKLSKLHLLTSKPLILNPEMPFHYTFPVIALARGRIIPNTGELSRKGSRFYSARQIATALGKNQLTPAAKNLLETLGQANKERKATKQR